MVNVLTPDEHVRIAQAIRKAEAATSGEVFVVVAKRSGRYRLAALLAPALASLAGGALAALIYPRMAASMLVLQQLAAFAALTAATLAPGLRRRLIPAAILRRRVHASAASQFLAHNVHATAARTGVLLYVSLFERMVVVLADQGVGDKASREEWPALVRLVTEHVARGELALGLEKAVERAGAVLSEHFPASGGPNELPDRVVEL
jgi:putative membrane protein